MYQVQHAGAAFGNVRDITKWRDLGPPIGLGEGSAIVDGLKREMGER